MHTTKMISWSIRMHMLVSGCRWKLQRDINAAMKFDRLRRCARWFTWPGTTALENNLFSWTSSLGVVSNLSAMLFNVSRDSTWNTKTRERTQKLTLLLLSEIHPTRCTEQTKVRERHRKHQKYRTLKGLICLLSSRNVIQIAVVSCWPENESWLLAET